MCVAGNKDKLTAADNTAAVQTSQPLQCTPATTPADPSAKHATPAPCLQLSLHEGISHERGAALVSTRAEQSADSRLGGGEGRADVVSAQQSVDKLVATKLFRAEQSAESRFGSERDTPADQSAQLSSDTPLGTKLARAEERQEFIWRCEGQS